VTLGRLKPGRYLLRLEVTATLNRGPTRALGARLTIF
jgi:hypothetical protein